MTKITVTLTGDVADYIKAVAKEKDITIEASTQRVASIGMNRDRALGKYQGSGTKRPKAKAAKKTAKAAKKAVAKAGAKKVAKSGPKKKSRVARAKAEAPSNGISDGLDLSDVN